MRYTGSVAWREGIDNLHRVPVLSVQQQPGPPGPDLVNVLPDILICDPGLELLPDLEFLIVQKLLRNLNDIVQELSIVIIKKVVLSVKIELPDELHCLVLVGVIPAVAELDQLLVGELKVPHVCKL